MGWTHEDSFEVSLVLRVLEALERDSESVNHTTGEVKHWVRFTREFSVPRGQFWVAAGKRFDFRVLVDDDTLPQEAAE